MSRFDPKIRTLEPADPTDPLARAILRSLDRPVRRFTPRGPLSTLLLAGLSFGVLPILIWSFRLRRTVQLQHQRMSHLAEWIGIHVDADHAQPLCRSADRIRFRTGLSLASILFLMGPIVAVAAILRHGGGPGDLLAATYRFLRLIPPHLGQSISRRLWIDSTVGLGLAYLLHWAQIQWHAADLRRFVREFNRVMGPDGIDPVAEPRLGWGRWGLQLFWLAGAALLMAGGGLWAAALMPAGALQERYIRCFDRSMRDDLARQFRRILSRTA